MASRFPQKPKQLPDTGLPPEGEIEQIRKWFAQLTLSRSVTEQLRLATAIRNALTLLPHIHDDMLECDVVAATEGAWDAAAGFRTCAEQQIMQMQASDNCVRRQTSGPTCSGTTTGMKHRPYGGLTGRLGCGAEYRTYDVSA